MAKLDVQMIKLEETAIYGLWMQSNDRTVAKDIERLSKQFYDVIEKQAGTVLPYFVLSRNYDEETENFELFIGSTVAYDGLQSLTLLSGQYAKITVKPKLGFIWSAAIGEAKQYFYTKWLPTSAYTAANMEFEYHTEKSVGKKPEIDIIFCLRER